MKCCFCGKDIGNGFGKGANGPEPLKHSSKNERCCDKCNENIVIPVRIFYDTEIRKLQYSKFGGDWYGASNSVFLGKSIIEICKKIPSVFKYLKEINYKE